MREQNRKKISTILYIVVLVAVFVMFLGTSYLYYIKVIKPDEVNIAVKNFDMLLMFNNGNQINGHNIKAGYEETKEFTIENYSNDTIGKYKIVLEVITPLSNISDENFVYVLEGSTDSKDNTNKVVNITETPVPVLTKDLGSAVITPKTTHSYKLTVRMNKSKNIVNENMFSLKIKIANDN